MSKNKRIDRLLVLADWLEKVVKPNLNGAKFDMNDWGYLPLSDDLDPTDEELAQLDSREPTSLRTAKECGYAGCAIGWGLMCPQLRKAGITKHASFGYGAFDVDCQSTADFFGLEEGGWGSTQPTRDTFEYLFMPESYSQPTLHNVVRRLRATHKRLSKAS